MREFFEKIPAIVILFIVVSVIRGLTRLFKKATDAQAAPAPEGETDDQRRVREIQERIRRIAAERRGQPVPPALPPTRVPPRRHERPVEPPPLLPPAKPAGESPLQRKLREIERRLQPASPPVRARPTAAEVERRQQLEEGREDFAERKFLAARHAQQLAEAQLAVAQSEVGLRTTARARLLEDLQDPSSLRRAFVLREVLGTPAGLR